MKSEYRLKVLNRIKEYEKAELWDKDVEDDPETYELKPNMVDYLDKKLFSKIKNNRQYKPSKNTIIKFAFALHLSLDETQQLLGTCGYVLSESIVDDVIIKHYLSQRMYCLEDVYREIKGRSL